MQDTRFEHNNMYTNEQSEKISQVINSLVQINNDRIEGYGQAAKETEDADLKVLFSGLMSRSQALNSQLSIEVLKYGGKPTDSTTTMGKAFRAWMDVKAALTGKNRKAILDSCVFGEDAAQETYEDAIKDSEHLPVYIIQLITDQKSQLLEDRNKVKFLRDRE